MSSDESRVLILHMSDIHFSVDAEFPNEKLKRIADIIDQSSHYLEIFLFVTGDIANRGAEEEYEPFKKMMSRLEKELEGFAGRVTILFVPGNHDISLSKDRTIETLARKIEQLGQESVYDADCSLMDPFFKLSASYGLFADSRASCSIHRTYGGGLKSLEVCLFNTAPFSLRDMSDKQLHFLPSSALDLLGEKNEDEIKIALMHHSTDWFEDESANQVNELLGEYVDLVFIGHEHDGHKEERKKKGRSITMMRAGETHPDTFYSSEICAVEIDLEALKCSEKRYTWNNNSKMFVDHEEGSDFEIDIKRPRWMSPQTDFIDALNPKIPGLGLTLDQVFIFPSLRVDIGSEKQNISASSVEEEADFWDLLRDKKVISIAGASNYGKTTILTQLYRSSLGQGYMPLLLTSATRVRSLNQAIKTLVREQFGDNDGSVSRYRQYRKCKKILFVDDFDLLDKKESDSTIINSLLEHFGVIVFTVDHMINEGITETIKANLGAEYTMASLRIKDMYADKRADFIERVCSLKGKTSEETDEIRKTIEVAVSRHRGLYDLSPDFILKSIQYYLTYGTTERQEEVPYSLIFEASLTKQLEVAVKTDYGNDLSHAVSECFVFLGEIASLMHSNKNEYIGFDDACEQIRAYCNAHLLHSEPGKVIGAVITAEIMRYEDDPKTGKTSLKFSRDTYLAYFVAKWLDLEQKKGKDISCHISRIVNGLCFRINENILLFLAYLRTQTRFPLDFCEAAQKAMGTTKEVLSFDRGTIQFLARWRPKIDVQMTAPSERKSTEKMIAAVEESSLSDISLSYRGPYEYTDEDCLSQINRVDGAMKCLRLVGKSLVSLNEVLEATDKELIVDTLFEVPNKILYEMFHDLDTNFDGTAKEMHRILKEENPEFSASVDDVKKEFYFICIALCLYLYDQIAFDSSTRGTVGLFAEFSKKDTNARIQNLCMVSCAYSSDEFIDYAINAFQEAQRSNNSLEIFCIRLLVNHYLLQHSRIPDAVLQKCSIKIFGEKDYKKRLRSNRGHKQKGNT